MKSLSEIETTTKRASRAAGFSWGVAEEFLKSFFRVVSNGEAETHTRTEYIIDKAIHRRELTVPMKALVG